MVLKVYLVYEITKINSYFGNSLPQQVGAHRYNLNIIQDNTCKFTSTFNVRGWFWKDTAVNQSVWWKTKTKAFIGSC